MTYVTKTHNRNTIRVSLLYMWPQCEYESGQKSPKPKYRCHDNDDNVTMIMMMMTTQ